LRKVVYRQEGVKQGKVIVEGKKNKWGENISELARPLTSAYVFPRGHRVRAHSASSAAIKLPFPTFESQGAVQSCTVGFRYDTAPEG